MAASLMFAARKICSRALGRPPQLYFRAAVKEEQSLLLPRIGHGRSFPRRFSSSESSLSKKQHGPQSAANTTKSSKHTPCHPNYVRNIFFGTIGTAIGVLAILYGVARTHGGPIFREQLLGLPPKPSKEDD
uniref:Uncharacterized protein n=1 Tax=Triticum urartu TaxID=4572 RepID=A0A8R7PSF3_TRIUA